MAYRMKHKKSDGSIEHTRVDGDSVSTFVQKYEGTRGIIVKDSKQRKVGYNFHPSMSREKRIAEIRDGLNEERKEFLHTKGFSKGKTMKKVASIPPELWWSEKVEKGPEALRSAKDIKRFCSEWNLNVSKW